MKKKFGFCISIFLFVFLLISCSQSSSHIESSDLPSPTKTFTSTPVSIPSPSPTVTPTQNPDLITSQNVNQVVFLTKFGNERYLSMDWSPDGKYIAAYGEHYLDIFDANNFSLVRSIKFEDQYQAINCEKCSTHYYYGKLLFSPDSTKIATYNNNVLLWNVETGKFVRMFNFKGSDSLSLSFSPDSSLIAGYGWEHFTCLSIWETETGEWKNEFCNRELKSSASVINPDNSRFAAYGSNLRIWDLDSHEIIKEIELPGGKAMDISPQGDSFVIASNSGLIYIYDFDGNLLKELSALRNGSPSGIISSIQYDPKGKLLLIGDRRGSFKIIKIDTGNVLSNIAVDGFYLCEASFNPEGDKIATLSQDGHIRIYGINTTNRIYPLITPTPDINVQNNFESLPYDQYILYSKDDSSLNVRSIDGEINQLLMDRFYGLPFSADGRMLQLLNWSSPTGNTLNLLNGTQITNNYTGYPSPKGDWIADIDTIEHETGILFHNISGQSDQFIPLNLPVTPELDVYDHIDHLSWSTDGKSIFYIRYTEQVGMNGNPPPWDVLPTNGLYIMDVDCLQNPDTCLETQKFIYSPYKIRHYNQWSISSDNRYAIVHCGDHFVIFDIVNNSVERIPFYIKDTTQYNSPELFISPDNQWVIFSTSDDNAYIQPLFGGQATKIMDASEFQYLLGWLTAPYLQPGDSFKVLPAGDHVYIRENPDLDSDELTFLISGNTFTVLDGPVQEDGYTWWYVESDVDGSKGWLSEFYGWYEKIE